MNIDAILKWLSVTNNQLMVAVGALLFIVVLLLLRKRDPKTTKKKENEKINPAIKKLISEGKYDAAARLAQNAGNYEDALDYYLRAQKISHAAQMAQRLKRPREAAELYEKARDYQRAASMYRQAGLKLEADEMLKRVKEEDENAAAAAELLSGGEDAFLTPTQRAEQAERAFEEALHHSKRGDKDSQEKVEQLGRDAAEALLSAGETRRAANVCRDAGLIDQAINLFVNLLGDPGSAALLLADRGDHRRAAELFESAGNKERAVDAWIRWTEDVEDPLECLDDIDRLGNKATFRFLDTLMEKKQPRSGEVDLHLRIADAYSKRNNNKSAALVLEDVIAVEPTSERAIKQLEKIRLILAQPTEVEAEDSRDENDAKESLDLANKVDPQVNKELEDFLNSPKLERLVNQVAASAAKKATALMGNSGASALLVPLDAVSAVRQKGNDIRGIEAVNLTMNLVHDSAVESAKRGPSVESLAKELSKVDIDAKNASLFYQLGLAQIAAGQWHEAKEAFSELEKAQPGYKDAADRAKELERWQDAVRESQVGIEGKNKEESRYEILGELGRGGMAVVYRAKDSALNREVALKFLAPEMTSQPMFLELFQREAQAAAQLNHPNIVTIYDVGTIDGRAFICMELIPGISVEELLDRSERLVVLDALRIAEAVLSAIKYAHDSDIIHRDIKPSNVMRSDLGVVKLMDFGLAKSVDKGGAQRTTMIAGTPNYMAPEQFTGKNVDALSDIFAVGASVYEMLTGIPPFDGMQRDKAPRPPSELNPEVPQVIDTLILKSLEFERKKRIQSADEMLLPIRKLLKNAGDQLATIDTRERQSEKEKEEAVSEEKIKASSDTMVANPSKAKERRKRTVLGSKAARGGAAQKIVENSKTILGMATDETLLAENAKENAIEKAKTKADAETIVPGTRSAKNLADKKKEDKTPKKANAKTLREEHKLRQGPTGTIIHGLAKKEDEKEEKPPTRSKTWG